MGRRSRDGLGRDGRSGRATSGKGRESGGEHGLIAMRKTRRYC